MTPILEFNDVSLSIGSRDILKKLTFSITEKKFVGLLGENGSGKTTLLRTIIRFFKPASGTIQLAGEDLNNLSQRKIAEILSYVPQSLQIAFNSLVDHFFTNLDEPHTHSLIKELKIGRFLQRPFLSLSGGERQRVLLASALSGKPRILLLDELTQYADTATTKLLGEFLHSYRLNFGLSIVAVSHDMEWIVRFTEEALVLDSGSIQTAGPSQNVIQLLKQKVKDLS